ncbi:MAG: hypothetical protein U0519_01750 [Candidatus Gracilibacteria bacterium]
MMRFDQYASEEQAIREVVHHELQGYEEKLMMLFIQQGPQALRSQLKVSSDFVWGVVFDHLVFDLDVLKRCVDMFFPFFKDYVLQHGPVALREVFGIQDEAYDPVFEKLMDDMVIARGLLFEHIHKHTSDYLLALEKGYSEGIRRQLGMMNAKYDPLWKEVVDFLLDAYTREKLKEKQKTQTKSLLSLLQSLLSE